MKYIHLSFAFLLLSSISASSQVTWEKLFSKKSTDVFRSVQEVTTGGYIVAGYTANFTANDTDAFVVRLNVNGDTVWTYTYNGPQSRQDLFYKIIETSDGGFLACGYTNSGTSDDILYIKLNSAGIFQWAKNYGGSGKERSQDIVETIDGYTIAGYTTSSPAQYYDALILHFDFNGTVLWTKIIGSADYEDANSLKLLPDGGYILGGQIRINGSNYDQYLIRTNSSGDTLWTRHFGTSGTDNIESIVIVSDGYVMAGSTNSILTGDDGYLVKTDTSGNVIWSKTFGGNYPDDFHRVEKTSDGGFILTGTTSSSGASNPNMWLLKTNAQGNQLWSTPLGGDNHDHGYSGIQTSDGGYIIAGHSGSFGFNNEEAYIVKLGSGGVAPNKLTYVSAFALTSPTCTGTASQVKVVIRNFGNRVVSNIPVTVEVTGATTQTLNAIYSGSLAAQDLDTVSLSPVINTMGGSSYTFHCFTSALNDVYPANNSITSTVSLLPCTGIDELHARLGYIIYPNPSNGNFIIEFSENYRNAIIELFSITGAVLKKQILENTISEKIFFGNSNLTSGIYLLKVNADGLSDTRMIIVE